MNTATPRFHKPADLLIKSDAVFTGLNEFPIKGCIAILGNKIIKAGSWNEVKPYISAETKTFEFQDAFVMPGFIDSHMHYFCGVFQTSKYICRDLFNAASEDECVEMIREFGQKHPEYDKISGMGWFPPLWHDKTAMPSKDSLDKIEPDRPVYLLSTASSLR